MIDVGYNGSSIIFFFIGNMISPQGLRSCSSEKRNIRIRKRQERKLLRQKQNGFVLDCLNQAKSHAKSYNSINDKFLRYCIIKLLHAVKSTEELEKKNHEKFQEMLQQQREKLLGLLNSASVGESESEGKMKAACKTSERW